MDSNHWVVYRFVDTDRSRGGPDQASLRGTVHINEARKPYAVLRCAARTADADANRALVKRNGDLKEIPRLNLLGTFRSFQRPDKAIGMCAFRCIRFP